MVTTCGHSTGQSQGQLGDMWEEGGRGVSLENVARYGLRTPVVWSSGNCWLVVVVIWLVVSRLWLWLYVLVVEKKGLLIFVGELGVEKREGGVREREREREREKEMREI